MKFQKKCSVLIASFPHTTKLWSLKMLRIRLGAGFKGKKKKDVKCSFQIRISFLPNYKRSETCAARRSAAGDAAVGGIKNPGASSSEHFPSISTLMLFQALCIQRRRSQTGRRAARNKTPTSPVTAPLSNEGHEKSTLVSLRDLRFEKKKKTFSSSSYS